MHVDKSALLGSYRHWLQDSMTGRFFPVLVKYLRSLSGKPHNKRTLPVKNGRVKYAENLKAAQKYLKLLHMVFSLICLAFFLSFLEFSIFQNLELK